MRDSDCKGDDTWDPESAWVQPVYDILTRERPTLFAWLYLGQGSQPPAGGDLQLPSSDVALESLITRALPNAPGGIYVPVGAPSRLRSLTAKTASSSVWKRLIAEVSCMDRPTKQDLAALAAARSNAVRVALAVAGTSAPYRVMSAVRPDYVRVAAGAIKEPPDPDSLDSLATLNDRAWRVGALPLWEGLRSKAAVAAARRLGVWYACGPALASALPLSQTATWVGQAPTDPPELREAVLRAAATVLVVDDSPTSLVTEAAALRAGPYRVLTARSGAEGISRATREGPDLVLLGMRVAEASGFEVCRRLRTHPVTRTVPLILLAALEDSASLEVCAAHGCDGYVAKPIDPAQLLAKVHDCLGRSSR